MSLGFPKPRPRALEKKDRARKKQSAEDVQNALVKARVPASYWQKTVDLHRLADMHLAGDSSFKIAAVLGISQCAVMRRIKSLDLPRHKTGRRKGGHGELR